MKRTRAIIPRLGYKPIIQKTTIYRSSVASIHNRTTGEEFRAYFEALENDDPTKDLKQYNYLYTSAWLLENGPRSSMHVQKYIEKAKGVIMSYIERRAFSRFVGRFSPSFRQRFSAIYNKDYYGRSVFNLKKFIDLLESRNPERYTIEVKDKLAVVSLCIEMINIACDMHNRLLEVRNEEDNLNARKSRDANLGKLISGDYLHSYAVDTISKLGSVAVNEYFSIIIENLSKGMIPLENNHLASQEQLDEYVMRVFYRSGLFMGYACKSIAEISGEDEYFKDLAFRYGVEFGFLHHFQADLKKRHLTVDKSLLDQELLATGKFKFPDAMQEFFDKFEGGAQKNFLEHELLWK